MNKHDEESLDKFYKQIYNLAYITRYSGVPRIKNESVAEHSFFVSALLVKLHDLYHFDLGSALIMATVHDWAESFIGDITMKVRREYPAIDDVVEDAECAVISKNFSNSISDKWFEYYQQKSLEAKIVMMADILQVIQYSEHEVKLGNDGYMQEVVDSAHRRLQAIAGDLEYAKR